MLKKISKSFRENRLSSLLLCLLLVVAFIIRVYRIDKLLGFYYDQGRDALVIWDLWHKGKFFLIGPTTGLAGIFRAPYYYYLIAPFYLIGNGNPLYPSVFLIITSVVAIGFIYYLGMKIQDRATGLIAAAISAFSFNLVMASRWFSNPTPMLLLSMILVWGMLKVTRGIRWGWPIIAATAGLSLFSFGSAGELFYFLAIFIFIIWQRKNWPDRKNLIFSIILFGLTLAPLIVFDIKHGGILRGNIGKTFVAEKSFTLPTKYLLENRSPFYYDVFTNKIFHYRRNVEKYALLAVAAAFIFFFPQFLKNKGVKVLLLLLASPIIGLYFYQGNYTVLYDYYMTGYYLIFILLFAVVLGKIWQYRFGKLLITLFLYLFLTNNYAPLRFKLTDESGSPGSIAFVNQKQAIDWVFQDAKDTPFNVDVYVPPVIPYAYDYLFRWYGQKYSRAPSESLTPLLYTVYEADSNHQDRLDAWMVRQKGIGKVEEQFRSGGITVQRRIRIK